MCFWVVLRTVETVENPYAISETLAGRIRTSDLRFRKPVLYPTELREQEC